MIGALKTLQWDTAEHPILQKKESPHKFSMLCAWLCPNPTILIYTV